MVLTASETRKQARESLKGKWGTVVLITLLYLVYNFLVGVLSAIPFLGFIVDIAAIVIGFPISFGYYMNMMKLKRGENVGYFDFFKDGFANFKRAWCVAGRLILKMIIPIILILVALIIWIVSLLVSVATAFAVSTTKAIGGAVLGVGAFTLIAYLIIIAAYVWIIIKLFSYGLSIFIAIDNPNMRPADCVIKSKEYMDGHKGRLFCLLISFIGWWFLTALVAIIPFVGWLSIVAAVLLLVPYVLFATIIFYENRVDDKGSAKVAEATTVTSTNTPDATSTNNTNIDNTVVDTNTNNNTTNTIKEKSGSTDVKAEIVDIPEMDEDNKNE